MTVLAQPALYVGGVNLNNRFGLEILWKQTEGLFDGSALEAGATIQTFDGPAKVRAHDMAYQARRLVITGRIINRSGWLDKQKAIADLAEVFAGRPAIVRMGTLYLEAEFGQVKLVDDAYSHLPGYQTWRVEGEAIPGTFFSQYHTALGADQGLAVQDDRPDSSAVKFSSNSFTYSCPGTAPTEACISLTGTVSTTYYLKGRGLRRVPMTTDAAGNASIDEMSGFLAYPGANPIRVEDSAGALAAGVTAVNLYGTRPRFLGNAPTSATVQSATTNRMSEGPMLTVARTGSKTYISLAGTLSTATDGQPAIGVPTGTYSATKAGLALEGSATNLMLNNRAHGGVLTGWAVSNAGTQTAPGTTAGVVLDGAQQWFVLSTATSYACFGHRVVTLLPSTTYTLSGYFFVSTGASGTWELAVLKGDLTAGPYARQTVTERNTWVYKTFTFTTPAVETSYAVGFGSLASGGGSVAGDFSAITFAQLEIGPIATSLIVNDSTTTAATRNADVCGIVYPQNELIHSHDLTQGATGSGTWNRTAGASVTRSGSDNTVTLAATTDALYQAVAPACVPSTTRTAAARLKLGTLSGSVLLRLLDQSGNVIATKTINTSELSASEVRTFYVTGTPSADDTGLRVQLIGNSGTGTVIVRSLGLVKGSNPGVEVQTGDTPIPAPTSPVLDPAWQQNGSMEFYATLPALPASSSDTYVLGGLSLRDRHALWVYSNSMVIFSKAHNGTTGNLGLTPSGYSSSFSVSQRNKFKIVWKNHTIGGVRYMPLELWLNDALIASSDAATTQGATAWATIDPNKLVSDGTVNATISAPSDGQMFSYPTLPAGAIPA